MKPSVWHLYCEKNIWFRASGTFFEQVIKYSVSYHGTEWQCQGLSRLCLSDFIRSCSQSKLSSVSAEMSHPRNPVYMAKVMMALSCRDIVLSCSKVCLIAVSSCSVRY